MEPSSPWTGSGAEWVPPPPSILHLACSARGHFSTRTLSLDSQKGPHIKKGEKLLAKSKVYSITSPHFPAHTHTDTHTHTHTGTHTHTLAHTHTGTYTHTHTGTHTHRHTHWHINTHTHSFTEEESESRRDGGGNQSGVGWDQISCPCSDLAQKMTLDPPQGNKIALEHVLWAQQSQDIAR